MKLVIVSDNHGDAEILEAIKQRYRQTQAVFIHCGDSQLDPDSEAMTSWQAVSGNNDFGLGYPQSRLMTVGRENILVVHGHRDGVNFGLTKLSLHAQAEEATICCYGHTHQLAVAMDRGCCSLIRAVLACPAGNTAISEGLLPLWTLIIIVAGYSITVANFVNYRA